MRARAEAAITVFVGPTLASSPSAGKRRRGVHRRPPIRRHDMERLVRAAGRPGIVAIVDGVFHDTLAVGHAEIREALGLGWRVWGLSSMGAIRAREMAPLGMHGFGRVFRRFCAGDDFQDDEVALLHEPSPPYRAASEPLVHLRAAIAHLVARGMVRDDDAREVLLDLKSRWYGERTLEGTMRALAGRSRGSRSALEGELRDFHRFRWKTLDLEDFLRERPWIA
jgi:hypothetical protein